MKKSRGFLAVDMLLLVLMVLPLLACIVLKVLFTPASDDISISGALIFFTIRMPVGTLPVTESQVNSLGVILAILFLCLYMTHGLKVHAETKRQLFAEWIVEKCEGMVKGNMGEYFAGFAPFIAGIMALSAFSSLVSLIGLYSPTSDINVVAGWAVLVFILITYYKFKCGPLHYLKSFTEPVAVMTPMNVISEIATPVSMSFRHYGNILSGSVISVLIATGLAGLSKAILGWIPGVVGQFPLLRIGLPAVLSLYFDLFSGILQAYIFAMLTMVYVSGAFPADDYEKRRQARVLKKMQKQAKQL